MTNTMEERQVWKSLYQQQVPLTKAHACRDYLRGFEKLALTDRIPTLDQLNQRINPCTGWKVMTTEVRYSYDEQWYSHYKRKEFMTTDYLRAMENLNFSPEPDMFHDVFGHLPYLTLPEHADLYTMFAQAFFSIPGENYRFFQRLGWYVIEAGLIRENGAIKVYGSALISSRREIENIVQGRASIEPFIAENVMQQSLPDPVYSGEDAIRSQGENKRFFLFDSLEELKQELSVAFTKLSRSQAYVYSTT